MKKLNYLLLGLAGLAMASCSQEDLVGPAGNGDGNFAITVKLPADMATRAELGDGLAASTLKFAVYDVTGDLAKTPKFSFEDVAYFGNSLETTVNLNLISGKNYQLAFFAFSPEAADVYTFTPDPEEADGGIPNISVNYEAMTGSADIADAYDCFFALTETYTAGTSASPYQVTLNRPVAQINWGTSELDANNEIISTFGEGGEFIQTNATVTGEVYTQFNILDDAVADESLETITLFSKSPAGVPEGTPFPVAPETYDYVAVQYLLVPAESSTYDLTLNISNNAGEGAGDQNIAIAVSNAPVQANYRTNIYGNLLSTNAEFTVTKDPIFAGNYNQPYPETWDGTTVTIPTQDSEGNYVIAQPSDLAGLAAMVNGTNGQTASDLSGKTFILEADIDMGENSLSIGSASRSSATANGNSFKGTFDGGGHTIKNISFTAPSDLDKNTSVGVFPSVSGATAVVKDVTFENLQINAGAAEQAGVVGMLTDGATVSGVTVASGQISATEGAGGIVGRMTQNGTVENCENHAEIIVKQQNAGGIVGAAYYTSTEGNGMIVKGCKNYGNISGTASSSVAIGGIIGLNAGTVESCDNYGDVTGSQNSVGGIVGAQQSAGYIKNCNNSGTVSAPNATMAVGGIVGWVKYLNTSAYPKENIIEVTGCVNTGDVYGNNGTGGIVGSWYRAGYCTYNKNTANIISAKTGFVAGIIGSSQFLLEGNNGPAPDKVDGYVDMLYVENNQTTTTWDNMFGTLKSWIVYVNSSQYVTLTNNTPNQFANGEDGAN